MHGVALGQVTSGSMDIHFQSPLNGNGWPDFGSQEHSQFRTIKDTNLKIITYIGRIHNGMHFSLTGTSVTLTIDEKDG